MLKKVTSLADLRRRASEDTRYEALALIAARNLGGVRTKDFNKAMGWLAVEGLDTMGSTDDLIDEINDCREFLRPEKPKAQKAAEEPKKVEGWMSQSEAAAAVPLPSETANSVCLSAASEVNSSSLIRTPFTANNQEQKTMTVILHKRNVEKSGNTAYSIPGLKASVYFNKQMFADPTQAPETIEITAPDGTFAQPGAVKPVVTSAEAIAKAKEAAEKAQARAEKAAALAAKAAARAAKLVPADQPSL